MEERCCQFCGSPLPAGTLYYKCRTEIISGHDEDYPYRGDEDGDMDALIARLEKMDGQAAMDAVYQELTMVLCPACRPRLVTMLTGMRQGKVSQAKRKGKVVPFPSKP